jgi:O-antigen/teichoic acid export membrane protein
MNTKSSQIGIGADGTLAAPDPYASGTVKKAAWQYLLGRILTGCAGFAYLIILVRIMDAVSFARFVTMIGYAATVGLFCGFGLDKVASRYVPEGRLFHIGAKLNNLIAALTAVRLAVLLIATVSTYVAWPFLARTFFSGVNQMPAGLMMLIVGLNLFQFISLILQALIQQRLLTQILIAQWAVRLTVLAILTKLAMPVGLTEALLISALPELIGAVALAIFTYRYLSLISKDAKAPSHGPAWPTRQAALQLALHNCGYAWLVAAPQGNSMVMISASLVSAPFVAAYGFFTGLIDRIKMYLPMMLVLNLVEPVLTAGYMRDKDFKGLADKAVLLYKMNCLLVIGMAIWVALIAAPLTSILTNGRFLEYSIVLPFLLLQLAMGSQNIILQIIVNNVGRSDFLTWSGLSALLAMGLTFIVIVLTGQSRYFFLAPLIYELINAFTIIFLLKRNGFDYPTNVAFYIGLSMTSAVAYLLCRPILNLLTTPLAVVICSGVGVAIVFLISLYVFPLLRKDEWAMLRQLMRGKR